MAFWTRTHHLFLLVILIPLFLWSHTISTVSSSNGFARSSSLREHLRASKPIHRSFHGQRNVHYFPAYKPSPSSPDYDHRRSLQTNTTDISTSKKQPQAIRWLVGVAMGVISGILTVLVFYAVSHLIRWGINQKRLILKPIIYQRSIHSKSIAFLQDENALESLDLLGKGGSGEVYKATLTMQTRGGHSSTKIVAIKKVNGISNVMMIKKKKKMMIKKNKKQEEMDRHSVPAEEEEETEEIDVLTKNSAQIRAEMDTLGHVRHRNLLTLLAYVPRPNTHLLIYDYMINGSLSDALAKARDGSLDLDWSMRYSIALGVAKGLKYLHNDARPRIIHRDLKPGNILLDEAMEAHIGDFGLAKLVLDDSTHVTGSNWVGTVGYVAPEYYHALNFTDKGDVYAFGVVLVVLLTNQQPLSEMFLEDGDTYMGGWAANTISMGSEHILGKFDKRLLGHGFEEQMLLTFRIASFCLAKSPSARPSSIDVLAMLNQVAQAHL